MTYYRKPLIDTRPKCEWCGWRGQAKDFTRVFVGYASGVYVGKTLQLCPSCAASYQTPATRPACEVSQEEAASLNTFYPGIDA